MLWLALACTPVDTDSIAQYDALFPDDVCSPEVTVPGPVGAAVVPADRDAPVYGDLPAPFQVRLGLPTSDPSTSRSFTWRTDRETLVSTVEIQGPSGYVGTFAGASFLFDRGDARIHEVHACGLAPGAAYRYRVGGPQAFSTWHEMSTPPSPSTSDSFRFAVVGDCRDHPEVWGMLARAMDQANPDFILFTGDAVSSGSNLSDWDAFFNAAGEQLARRPLLFAHGNHEFLAPDYFAEVSMPGNEQWYDVRWRNAHFVALNDTVVDDADMTTTEPAFMDAAFGGDDPMVWRVTFHHQDLYAITQAHASDLPLRAAWAPVLDRNHVAFDFEGHNHAYERTSPIKADALAPDGKGTTYVVAGGGGAPLYYESVPDQWYANQRHVIHSWVMVDVTPETVTLSAFDVHGRLLDTTTVQHP
jgi:hypothetical protein